MLNMGGFGLKKKLHEPFLYTPHSPLGVGLPNCLILSKLGAYMYLWFALYIAI
jgi:hypothetical protein